MELKQYLNENMLNENIPILFIGAGFTKRYCTIKGSPPPKWNELLYKIISLYETNPYHYNVLENEVDKEIKEPIEKASAIYYQKIAKKIEEEFNDKVLRRELLDKKTEEEILKIFNSDRNVSPMKIYISFLFKELELTSDPILLKELDEIKKIASKPLIVLTTNYDNFLENEIFREYYVYKGQELLTDSYFASIFKIHGCITQPKSIILTESDYLRMEKTQKVLNARLITFFAEHPVFFLGYSFDDLNIQEFTNNVFESFSGDSEIIKKISKKFILIDWEKDNPNTTVEDYAIMKNKPMLIKKIRTDNYLEIYKALNNFEINIDIKQFQFMQDLFLVALSGDKEEKLDIVFANEYTGGKLPKKILVGAGYAASFLGYDLNDHYQKILGKEKTVFPINCDYFFMKFLHILKRMGGNTCIPVFYFLKDFNFTKELSDKNIVTIEHSLKKIISIYQEYGTIEKENTYGDIKEILEADIKPSKREKYITQLYVNEKILNEEMRDYIWENINCLNTFFRRMILLYDYKINSNSKVKEKIKEKLNIDLS